MADDAKTLIEALDIDLAGIEDPQMRRGFVAVLNIVQQLSEENARLRQQVQKLKDEIVRLKGEQGKPDVKPSKKTGASRRRSSGRRARRARSASGRSGGSK